MKLSEMLEKEEGDIRVWIEKAHQLEESNANLFRQVNKLIEKLVEGVELLTVLLDIVLGRRDQEVDDAKKDFFKEAERWNDIVKDLGI